jgi:hypothetical protein
MIQSSVKSGFRMYVRCEVCDGTYTSYVKLLVHGAHTLATPEESRPPGHPALTYAPEH